MFFLARIIGTFGLIEVGETILDPFGDDPEDFALLHFVEVRVCAFLLTRSLAPFPRSRMPCALSHAQTS